MNQDRADSAMPSSARVARRIWWLTVSNAADRSCSHGAIFYISQLQSYNTVIPYTVDVWENVNQYRFRVKAELDLSVFAQRGSLEVYFCSSLD